MAWEPVSASATSHTAATNDSRVWVRFRCAPGRSTPRPMFFSIRRCAWQHWPPPRKVPGQSRLIEVILVDQVAGVSDQHKQGFEGFRSESAPFVNRKARERVEVSSDIHSVQPTYSFPLTAEHG